MSDDTKPMLIRLTTLAAGSGSGVAASNIEHLSCATCKWWWKAEERDRAIEPLAGRTIGICGLHHDNPLGNVTPPLAYIGLRYEHEDSDHSAFVTDATFGCVQWEGK